MRRLSSRVVYKLYGTGRIRGVEALDLGVRNQGVDKQLPGAIISAYMIMR